MTADSADQSLLTPPTSERLEALRAQRQQLGTHRHGVHQAWQQTLITLRALYEDPRRRDSAEYEEQQQRRRDLEAELAAIDAETVGLRHETAQELATVGAPYKAALRAHYVQALAVYLGKVQETAQAQQACQAVVQQGIALLGAHGASLPAFHLALPLKPHAKEVQRWLAQQDHRYA